MPCQENGGHPEHREGSVGDEILRCTQDDRATLKPNPNQGYDMLSSLMENAMKYFQFLLTATAAILSMGVNAQMKEMPGGLWEMRMKMDIPGMPPEMAAKMGERVMTQCVKPGEKKWSEQRPPDARGESKCEQTDMKVSGNTVAWKMKCADGTTGEGTVTHNGKDAYKMNMTMNSPRGNMKKIGRASCRERV